MPMVKTHRWSMQKEKFPNSLKNLVFRAKIFGPRHENYLPVLKIVAPVVFRLFSPSKANAASDKSYF